MYFFKLNTKVLHHLKKEKKTQYISLRQFSLYIRKYGCDRFKIESVVKSKLVFI